MMGAMAAPHAEPALQRLATEVSRRRVSLGMHKIDVARAAGITITTYGKIEDGASVRDTTYGKLEPVLGWAAGTCRDILGGATVPTLVEARDGGAVDSPVLPQDLADDIARAVQDAAVTVSDGLTAAQIREMKQLVVEQVLDQMRKRGKNPGIEGN